MENTSVTFIMSAYTFIEEYKYLHFAVFLLLYLLITFCSLLITTAILRERSMYQPMYFLICNLSLNGVYGSTGLVPALLHLLLSDSYEMSLQCCLTQIYFLHTYVTIEFTILAVMGYDRYVAICYPLHYHHIMSFSRVCKLIAFSWMYPSILFIIYFSLTLRLKFCGKFIPKLFCVNFELVKLSCIDSSINSIVGLLSLCVFVFPQLLMILFSYAQILRVCLQSSKDSQIKAIKTCIPHLMSMVNYILGSFFEMVQSRINMDHVPHEARIFLSLYYILIAPLFNVAIYGISSRSIRQQILKMLCVKSKLTPG